MTVETEGSWQTDAEKRSSVPWGKITAWLGRITAWVGRGSRILSRYGFSSLTRRILTLNLVALVGLLSGMFFMNQFREGLIDARIQSLLTQGEIIAAAISASATVDVDTITVDPELLLNLENGQSISPFENDFDSLEFPIDPTQVAPILRHLILPTGTRARIYDKEGSIILDSRDLYTRGQILRYDLPAIDAEDDSWLEGLWRQVMLWLRRGDLPLYEELGPDSDRTYPEVTAAMAGSKGTMVRVNEHGELLVSVAVPVRRN
ncbi:MAG: stimulus-sensing domain-containing protein, partial [Fimbriimonadaceae bacterium]|nr:stimulus-sensing domain-containing protein [Alphaproteobacteria bacterium]